MPNLVVYVPAKLWKRLEEEMGAEWAPWARELTVKHIEEFLNGRLPEREVTTKFQTVEVVEGRTATASASPLSRSGNCPMNPPTGTKCKACGKVHPL